MTLTPEDYKLLKRPFTKDAVKFRIDGRPDNGKVRILTYIDSRLAVERLTEVDPGWQAPQPYVLGHPSSLEDAMKAGLPVVQSLIVKGVERADVGQLGPAKWGDNKGSFEADDKHAKMALSDALKRSAVLFHVGAYLYTLGDVKVDVKKHTTEGKGKALNKAGKEYLREKYAEFISRPAFVERFGEPIAYGEELAAETEAETKEAPDSDTSPADVQDASGEAPAEKPKAKASKVRQKKAPKMPSEATEEPPKATEGQDPYVEAIANLFTLMGRSEEAGREWAGARKLKSAALKKTLRSAKEKGADAGKIEDLLGAHGLEKYFEALV